MNHFVENAKTTLREDVTVMMFRPVRLCLFVLLMIVAGSLHASGSVTGELWTYGADTDIVTAPAVMGDSLIVFTGTDGSVTALRMDGTQAWRYMTGRTNVSYPVIDRNGTIYVQDMDMLTALNADGSLKWQYPGISEETKNWSDPSPAIGHDGTIYTNGDGYVYAINPDGSRAWKFSTGNDMELLSGISVGPDGTLYFSDFRRTVYALREDGVVKWTYSSGGYTPVIPSVDFTGRVYITVSSGVLCIDPDGSLRWRYSTDGASVRGLPVIGSDGTMYILDSDGVLHAVNENGTRKWLYEAGSSYTSASPVLGADGLVYVISNEGKLTAVDSEGSFVYDYNIDVTPYTSPVIAENGVMLIGDNGGMLHAVQSDCFGYDGNAIWPCRGHDNGHSGRVTLPSHLGMIAGSVLDSVTGEPVAGMRVTADPGGYVGVTDADGMFTISGLPAAVYSLEAEMFGRLPVSMDDISVTGGNVTHVTLRAIRDRKWIKWIFHYGSGISGSPAILDDGTILIGGSSGVFHALNPDGTVRWTYETESYTTTPVVCPDGTICFGSGNHLYVLDRDGALIRKTPAAGQVLKLVAAKDGTIYFCCMDDCLYAVDGDGRVKWKLGLDNVSYNQPVLGYDGTIYCTAGNLLIAVDRYGEILWTFSCEDNSCTGVVIGNDGVLYVRSTDEHLYAVNPGGSLKWKYDTGTTYFTLPVIGAGNTIYFGTEREEFIALDGNGRLKWEYTVTSGVGTSPALGNDGIIYFGDRYENTFYAITNEGYLTWRLQAKGSIRGDPAVSPDGVVYFGTHSGYLYAVQTRSYGYEEDAPWPCSGKDNYNSATQDTPAGQTIIDGTVTSAADGSVIPGAVIHVSPGGYTTVTNSRGEYTVILSESGTYTVEASSTGWLTVTSEGIRVEKDRTVTVDLVMKNDTIRIKWKRYVGGPFDTFTPKTMAVADDGTVVIHTRNQLTALYPDGEIKWNFDTDTNIFSSPSIADDGTIYVPEQFGFYCFNDDGSVKWKKDAPGEILTTAFADDGTVYYIDFTYSGNYIRAIDPDGEELWSAFYNYDIYTPPAVGGDGNIYIGGHGRGVYCYSPGGDKKWTYSVASNTIDAPLAIGPDYTIYAVQKAGYIHAVRPDGSRKWKDEPSMKESLAAPVVGPDNTVYFVHGSGTVYAYDADGNRIWSFRDIRSKTTPALGADGTLYMGTANGDVLALDSEGVMKADITLGGKIYYSPKIAPDGTLYVYSNSGFLYALQTESYGYPAGPCWPCLFGNNRNTNRVARPDMPGRIEGIVRDTKTGDCIANALITVTPGDITATTDDDGNFVISGVTPGSYSLTASIFGYREGKPHEITVTGDGTVFVKLPLEPDVMRLLWVFDADFNDDVAIFDYSIDTSITLADNGTIYISNRHDLCAVTPDGELKWRNTLDMLNYGVSVDYEGTVYTASDKKIVYAVNPDSTIKWQYSLAASPEGTPAISPEGTLYIYARKQLYALNSDGSLNWTYTNDKITDTVSIDHEGVLYASSNQSTFFAVNPDGTEKWQASGGMTSGVAFGPDGTIYTSNSYKLLAYDRNGILKWDFPADSRIHSSPAVDTDGTIYVGTESGTFQAVTSGGTETWQFRAVGTWLSPPSIGSDGTVYFGDSEGFFYALNSDGTEQWRYETGGAIMGAAAISPSGVVYVGNMIGRLYAFQTESRGLKADAPWPTYACNNRRTSCLDPLTVGVTNEDTNITKPLSFSLGENRPNPFNPATVIPFILAEESRVKISIFNITGEKVVTLADRVYPAGNHTIEWNASGHASGVYLYRLETAGFTKTKKMILLK